MPNERYSAPYSTARATQAGSPGIDQDGRDFLARDLEDLLVVPDFEAVPVFLEVGAVCINYELHIRM